MLHINLSQINQKNKANHDQNLVSEKGLILSAFEEGNLSKNNFNEFYSVKIGTQNDENAVNNLSKNQIHTQRNSLARGESFDEDTKMKCEVEDHLQHIINQNIKQNECLKMQVEELRQQLAAQKKKMQKYKMFIIAKNRKQKQLQEAYTQIAVELKRQMSNSSVCFRKNKNSEVHQRQMQDAKIELENQKSKYKILEDQIIKMRQHYAKIDNQIKQKLSYDTQNIDKDQLNTSQHELNILNKFYEEQIARLTKKYANLTDQFEIKYQLIHQQNQQLHFENQSLNQKIKETQKKYLQNSQFKIQHLSSKNQIHKYLKKYNSELIPLIKDEEEPVIDEFTEVESQHQTFHSIISNQNRKEQQIKQDSFHTVRSLKSPILKTYSIDSNRYFERTESQDQFKTIRQLSSYYFQPSISTIKNLKKNSFYQSENEELYNILNGQNLTNNDDISNKKLLEEAEKKIQMLQIKVHQLENQLERKKNRNQRPKESSKVTNGGSGKQAKQKDVSEEFISILGFQKQQNFSLNQQQLGENSKQKDNFYKQQLEKLQMKVNLYEEQLSKLRNKCQKYRNDYLMQISHLQIKLKEKQENQNQLTEKYNSIKEYNQNLQLEVSEANKISFLKTQGNSMTNSKNNQFLKLFIKRKNTIQQLAKDFQIQCEILTQKELNIQNIELKEKVQILLNTFEALKQVLQKQCEGQDKYIWKNYKLTIKKQLCEEISNKIIFTIDSIREKNQEIIKNIKRQAIISSNGSQKLETLQSTLDMTQAENQLLNNQNERLKHRIQQLKLEQSLLKVDINQLRRQNLELRHQNDTMKQQIEEAMKSGFEKKSIIRNSGRYIEKQQNEKAHQFNGDFFFDFTQKREFNNLYSNLDEELKKLREQLQKQRQQNRKYVQKFSKKKKFYYLA